MHTNGCVLIEISMEIGMLNFWNVQWCVKLTLPIYQVELSITSSHKIPNFLFGMLKLILKYFEFCIPNIFFLTTKVMLVCIQKVLDENESLMSLLKVYMCREIVGLQGSPLTNPP